jgi:3-deoxy-D-manno-octulosonic-acid transferase
MLIYRTLSILFFPFIALYLLFRVYKKKEDKVRLKERFGYSTQPRPKGQIIWLHAVSVGEANSSLILVEELLKFLPQTSILFTTTTLTSASIIAAKLPQFQGRVIHQFLPVDSYFCVKNFLNFWKPRAALFVESEIWPNLIFEARQMGVSSFLINGRMSGKSGQKWLVVRKFGFKIFDYFSLIFAQTKEDQKRFQKLTNQEILFYGNLKSQAATLSVNEVELGKLKQQIANRKFFVAASTHKGEEESVIAAHKKLKQEFPDLLTILIPRHPNRAEEVKTLLNGINFVQRSKNEIITDSTELYLVDSLGELGIFYSLADFAFIGGSLLDIGGHNPFEAIKLNCAVISGRRGVFNFKEIYHKLEEENACVMIDSIDELVVALRKFMSDKNSHKAMKTKASAAIAESQNIAKNIVTKIDEILMLNY